MRGIGGSLAIVWLVVAGCSEGPALADLEPAISVRASTLGEDGDGLHVEVLVDSLRSLELGYGLCPDLGLRVRANGAAMLSIGTSNDDPCGTLEFYLSAAELDHAEDVRIEVRGRSGAKRELRLWAPFVVPELRFSPGVRAGDSVLFTAVPSAWFLEDAGLTASSGADHVEVPFTLRDSRDGVLFVPPGMAAGTWRLETTVGQVFSKPFEIEIIACEFLRCDAAWASCSGTEPCLQPELVGIGPSHLGALQVVP